jgi:hypothetical protein
MKSFFDVSPELRMRYRVDDFTDPWRKAQTIVCVHGESRIEERGSRIEDRGLRKSGVA